MGEAIVIANIQVILIDNTYRIILAFPMKLSSLSLRGVGGRKRLVYRNVTQGMRFGAPRLQGSLRHLQYWVRTLLETSLETYT